MPPPLVSLFDAATAEMLGAAILNVVEAVWDAAETTNVLPVPLPAGRRQMMRVCVHEVPVPIEQLAELIVTDPALDAPKLVPSIVIRAEAEVMVEGVRPVIVGAPNE